MLAMVTRGFLKASSPPRDLGGWAPTGDRGVYFWEMGPGVRGKIVLFHLQHYYTLTHPPPRSYGC